MTGPTWQCSDCDTYNDAGLRVCHLCEMPRSAATSRPVAEPLAPKRPDPLVAKPREPKKPPAKKPPAKKPPAKKPPAKRATAKSTPAPKPPATARKAPVTSGTGPPSRTRTGADADVTGSSPITSALDWECPVCAHYVVGRISCDVCGVIWTPDARTTVRGKPLPGSTLRSSPARGDGLRFGDPLPPRPTPREPTSGEVVAGCGCILFIAAVVVTLIVMLILNWSTVTSFLTGSDSSKSSATPSPTVSASGPCPKELVAMLPKRSSSGARLVAAYSRENVKERYAFCRTKAGKVYYFMAKKAGERYGRPTAAAKSGNGYLVRFPDSSFRFREGEVTAYDKDDKETWKEELIPESSTD